MENTEENRAKMNSFEGEVMNVHPPIEDYDGKMQSRVAIEVIETFAHGIEINVFNLDVIYQNSVGWDLGTYEWEEIDCTDWKFWGRTKDQVNNQPESGPTMFEKTGQTKDELLLAMLEDGHEFIWEGLVEME